jgi:LacI family transcriptional regulator
MSKKSHTVTRDDVALAAKVSSATVSYVVNNGPRPVATETRKKVLEVIQQLGYKPNAVARNLRLQHSTTIGLIIPDTYNPYFAEVARGVEQVAFDNGLTVVLCHSDYKLERELHYVEVLQRERAAGVIWFPATSSSEPAVRMDRYGIPLVVLDRILQGVRAPSVVADNFLGGYMAAQHLIELGHRVIGSITRPLVLYHTSERLRGFRAAMKEHHLEIDETLIVRGGFRLDDGCTAARELLTRAPRPTAIFAYNDFMAIGTLRFACEMGLQVPRQLSVVGFDDIPQAAFTCPALTTISQPKLEMGHEGANLLLEMMEGRTITSNQDAPLPVKLIIRESTAAPSTSPGTGQTRKK